MNPHATRKQKIFYWIPTTMLALVLLITGIGNLIPFEHIKTDMMEMGYPPFFMRILGTWKILAAITLLVPWDFKLKDWAYAGIIFDLTGAALSRIAVKSPAPEIIIPLIISCVALLSYAMKNKILREPHVFSYQQIKY